jgi:threonine synthase
VPVGNAGNITAYWAGFREYAESRLASRTPRMMGFQAAGAAPIVLNEIVEDPQTIASAIRIGNPASWKSAIAARDESGGAIDSVTDDEIMEAYRRIAREEGIFCEPASAASLAGLIKASQTRDLRGSTCVCIITGAGLKDPDTARTLAWRELEVPANLEALEAALPLG